MARDLNRTRTLLSLMVSLNKVSSYPFFYVILRVRARVRDSARLHGRTDARRGESVVRRAVPVASVVPATDGASTDATRFSERPSDGLNDSCYGNAIASPCICELSLPHPVECGKATRLIFAADPHQLIPSCVCARVHTCLYLGEIDLPFLQGVEVLHVDLAAQLPPAGQILELLDEHGVLLFRRQCLHDDDLFRFSASLGRVEEPAAYWDHSPDFKEINYIGNLNSPEADVANRWAGTSSLTDGAGLRRFLGKVIGYGPQAFHSDQMFRRHPATLSTLFCVVAPHEGGGTSFCSSIMGYEALPPDLKQEAHALSGRCKLVNIDNTYVTVALT